ncbi:MAG: PatB family C-S lyase [Prolixibacteraceae bacterium]|nr:PatB family C-S lyase [Prolixibacteraceae bacterium]
MQYDFDELISREGTNSIKYDARKNVFRNGEVIPLWVADTDFRTPDFIMNAIKTRAQHEILGYTFKPDSYYESIKGWMKRRYNWEVKKDWISYSPGVVSGLTLALEIFSEPGDGIIVQPPVYFPFFESVKGTGRKIVENPLKIENGRYIVDMEDLKSKTDKNTKVLLLCNPQNPGGTVRTYNELFELASFCLDNNILIISDEIHSDLIFPGHRHIPVATLSDDIAKNSVICMAPSKTFNMAGLSTSIIIIPDKTKVDSYEKTLNVRHLGMGNIFGSVALEAAYSQGDEWLEQLMEYLWKNYKFLEEFFRKHLPKARVMRPEATFLVWIDFTEYGMDDKELFRFIVEEAKVGLNNGDRFGTGGNGWMRLNIGCPASVLKEALTKMKNAFEKL